MNFPKIARAFAVVVAGFVGSATAAFADCTCYETRATFDTKGAVLHHGENRDLGAAKRDCKKGVAKAWGLSSSDISNVSSKSIREYRADSAKAASANMMNQHAYCPVVSTSSGHTMLTLRFSAPAPMMAPGD